MRTIPFARRQRTRRGFGVSKNCRRGAAEQLDASRAREGGTEFLVWCSHEVEFVFRTRDRPVLAARSPSTTSTKSRSSPMTASWRGSATRSPRLTSWKSSTPRRSAGDDEEEQSQSNCCVGEYGKHLWQCGYSTLVWSNTTLPWT
jgi:hypothetical protein